MRATAAIFEKLHAPFAVGDVDIDDDLRPGEALVQIVASGVCHTDALARDGDFPFPAPGVVGHEGAGVVRAVGAGVTSVSPGSTELAKRTLMLLKKRGSPFGQNFAMTCLAANPNVQRPCKMGRS